MTDLLLIVIAAVTVNNFVLTPLLGLEPVLKQRLGSNARAWRHAVRLALATTAVVTVANGLRYLLEVWVLTPWQLEYLRLFAVLIAVAVATGLLLGVVKAIRPESFARLAETFKQIMLNGTILGIVLLSTGASSGIAEALALGLGAGIGFGLILLLYVGLQRRLEQAPIPRAIRGPTIALLTIAIMSLAFFGFSGMGS